MRIAVVILAAIFLLGCTRFVIEFEDTPAENGESDITVTKVISWGALAVGRKDMFTVQKKIDKNGAVEYWVRRNTEENAQGQVEILKLIIGLAQSAALAQPLPALPTE